MFEYSKMCFTFDCILCLLVTSIMTQHDDWNKWLTLIAAFTVIVAIVIPFAQKKYDEMKAKISFHLYLKKYFGILFNILTYDEIEYTRPSIKDDSEKSTLTFLEFLRQFESDFKEHQNTLQTRVAFSIVFNLQNLLFVVHRIQSAIRHTDVDKLYEQTLAYGNRLTKKELNKIYGILLIMEHFNSIIQFHDRFGNMKSIQREIKNGIWVGLKVDQSLLKNQQLVAEDIKHLCNDEMSIQEIFKISKLLIQELKSFYDFEKLQKKRKGKQN